MAAGNSSIPGRTTPVAAHSRRRDLIELAVAYGLILLVIWTPRPWQKMLWWVAAAVVVAIATASFEGLQAMGLRRENVLLSFWIVGVALLLSAGSVVLAIKLRTLHVPATPLLFIETYVGYILWTFVQQLLMQCFFLSRLMRLISGPSRAALVTALIFAAAHLPNPILAPVTLLWGLAACLLFLRYRNLYTLAIAHAILGVTFTIAVPASVHHNMRVGLGYLTYGHAHPAAPLQRNQSSYTLKQSRQVAFSLRKSHIEHYRQEHVYSGFALAQP